MSVEIGQEAPDFELRSSTGDTVKLSQYRGEKAVAIVFIPFAFTGVCQGELCELRDDIARYDSADVQVVAISCDTAPTLKKWAEEQGYTFPVLADFWPHGAVAQAYGVFNDKLGCAMRGTFVVDKNGVLVDSFETDGLGVAREKARYDEALAKL